MGTKYLPTNIEGCLARLSEECAEVIQAVSKAQRFGLDNYHPVTKETNLAAIIREFQDLEHAYHSLINPDFEFVSKGQNQ